MVIAGLRFKPLKSEKTVLSSSGSMAIVVAFGLVMLCSFLAFLLNTGLLYGNRNLYQNAAEAAAMAGAVRLCDGDAIDIAKQIAKENGAPQGSVTVTLGFYDVENEHFFAEGSDNYPADEYNNAVMVSINSNVSTILGAFLGKEKTRVSARAVAYAESCGLLALGEDSEIRIGPGTGRGDQPLLKNGVIYSNGDIKLGRGATCSSWWGSTTYLPPEFENAGLYARGQVLECNTTCSGSTAVVHWDSCSESGRDNAFSGAPEFSGIKPCDDAFIDSLIQSLQNSANLSVIIYTPDDAGSDNIFFGTKNYGRTIYYRFDLCAEKGARQDRVVYIFDAEDDGQHGVWLEEAYPRHGEYIENVTFITKLPVRLDYNGVHHVGAEGDKQFILITSKDLEIAGCGLYLEGAVFRIGGSFSPCFASYIPSCGASLTQKARIIADGNIYLWGGQRPYGSVWTETIDFKFGPPCPVLKVHLGKL